MDQDQAQQGLEAIADAKRSLGTAAAAPLWRHAAFASLMAFIIFSVAVDHPLRSAAFLLAMGGTALLVMWDRKQTGMFVNGYRTGRTLPLTLALLIVMVGLAIVAVRLTSIGEPRLALLTVPAAFILALLASLWWERIFLAEMGVGR